MELDGNGRGRCLSDHPRICLWSRVGRGCRSEGASCRSCLPPTSVPGASVRSLGFQAENKGKELQKINLKKKTDKNDQNRCNFHDPKPGIRSLKFMIRNHQKLKNGKNTKIP